MAESEVGARAGHPIVTCTPIFRLALQWAKFNEQQEALMYVLRRIVSAIDESGRRAVMADSAAPVIAVPGDPRRTDGVFQVVLVTRRQP